MRQGLIDGVTEIVQQELEECIKQHGLFHSAHEGYAVISEEIDEVVAEFSEIAGKFARVWDFIKANLKHPSAELTKNIGEHAKLMACEVVQVAAMCQKFVESSKEWEK